MYFFYNLHVFLNTCVLFFDFNSFLYTFWIFRSSSLNENETTFKSYSYNTRLHKYRKVVKKDWTQSI